MRLALWWTAVVAASAARLRHQRLEHNAAYTLMLTNYNSVQYSASFSLGGQTLPVIYDTGSFEIIVLSTLCKTCKTRFSVYDSSKSSSFYATNITAEHVFGSGAVRSTKSYETVHFGSPGSPYLVRKMPFWQVLSHNMDVWNRAASFAGIVGLGHPDRIPLGFTADKHENDQAMLASMNIKSFALCLERSRRGAPGWLSVGPNSAAFQVGRPGFKALNVVGMVHWGMVMTNPKLPGVGAPNPCLPSCGAIIDSGTSLIAVPPSAAPLIRRLSSLINRDCSNIRSLPFLEMQVDSTVIRLPPAAYVMQVRTRVYNDSTIWRSIMRGSTKSKIVYECSAAFMTIDKTSQFGPVWILGMPFLRYYYTVFDRSLKQIHISHATPGCKPYTQTAGLAINGTRLANGTAAHFSNATKHFDEEADANGFTAADYEPTEVDLDAARKPGWALGPGKYLQL